MGVYLKQMNKLERIDKLNKFIVESNRVKERKQRLVTRLIPEIASLEARIIKAQREIKGLK